MVLENSIVFEHLGTAVMARLAICPQLQPKPKLPVMCPLLGDTSVKVSCERCLEAVGSTAFWRGARFWVISVVRI